MQPDRYYDAKGTLRLYWDNANRVFHRYSESGAEVTSRTFTAEEVAGLLAEEAAAAAVTEKTALTTAVRDIVTQVKAEKDALDLKFPVGITNPTINANPASYIKDVEKALERTMRAVVDLAKLTSTLDGLVN